MRVLLTQPPFQNYPPDAAWHQRGRWPCNWIGCPGAQVPFVAAYRLRFQIDRPETLRLHITADERYELFLDGKRIGRGPERSDPRHWAFETYDIPFQPGEHLLVARIWAFGELAPVAQLSVCPGFLLCPEDQRHWDHLGTGRAPWEVRLLDGYTFTHPMAAFGVGHKLVVDGKRFAWGFENGAGEGWLPASKLHSGFSASSLTEVQPHEHTLLPATLPPMLDEPRFIGSLRNLSAPALSETHSIPIRAIDHLAVEEPGWTALLRGQAPLTIPPNTRRRLLIDLENYYCAYPEVVVSGGAEGFIRLHWQESLFQELETWDKGHRGQVEGKYFTTMGWHRDGIGDTFRLDGGDHRQLDSLWWHAGRYVEILVETSNQPLTIEHLCFNETRYPLELESSFTADDARLERLIPVAVRALQMCAHETYMDCPYFEQLMYAGDTRLECLVTYIISRDDRLPRKALHTFDISRLPEGLTQSRYPSRIRQIIPPFSLWWVSMVHDYLFWRGDISFVKSLLPGMRAVLDFFTGLRDEDGLVHSPAGWNYVDWVPAWESGEPPGAQRGQVCGPINGQYLYALRKAAEVEQACSEPEMASRFRRLGKETAAGAISRLWDPTRGLFADNLEHTIFSEHSQCLAVLSGWISARQRDSIAHNLFAAPSLTKPTVYFVHYFFETCRELGRMDQFFERLRSWFEMSQLDFKTTYENADPHGNRSDCHAWGAHPLYHYFASVLGIRPTSPGFQTVEIRPQLGHLQRVSGKLAHPNGVIETDFNIEAGNLTGTINLPEGISGVLHQNGQDFPLLPGKNVVE